MQQKLVNGVTSSEDLTEQPKEPVQPHQPDGQKGKVMMMGRSGVIKLENVLRISGAILEIFFQRPNQFQGGRLLSVHALLAG